MKINRDIFLALTSALALNACGSDIQEGEDSAAATRQCVDSKPVELPKCRSEDEYCIAANRNLVPKLAKKTIECLNQGDHGYDCGKDTFGQACEAPEARALCKEATKACRTTPKAACKNLNGFNAAGLATIKDRFDQLLASFGNDESKCDWYLSSATEGALFEDVRLNCEAYGDVSVADHCLCAEGTTFSRVRGHCVPDKDWAAECKKAGGTWTENPEFPSCTCNDDSASYFVPYHAECVNLEELNKLCTDSNGTVEDETCECGTNKRTSYLTRKCAAVN